MSKNPGRCWVGTHLRSTSMSATSLNPAEVQQSCRAIGARRTSCRRTVRIRHDWLHASAARVPLHTRRTPGANVQRRVCRRRTGNTKDMLERNSTSAKRSRVMPHARATTNSVCERDEFGARATASSSARVAAGWSKWLPSPARRGRGSVTDEFGRVKVQFPWDRRGRNDERSSC